jgi:hypothetical protein
MKQLPAVLLLFGTLVSQKVAAQSRGFEARIGALGFVSRRNADFNASAVGTESGVMGGLDAIVHYRFLGFSACLWGGRFGSSTSNTPASGKIATGQLGLLVGLPSISAELGYGRRGLSRALATITWSFLTVGGRADVPIGATGLHASASLLAYARVREREGSGRGSGACGETSLAYLPSHLPIFIGLGYSVERFTARNVVTGPIPEDVSGFFIDAGLRIGDR